jgi:lipopolysaccharide/colanic/teichoic acid biosynthesis glycosyltransferase
LEKILNRKYIAHSEIDELYKVILSDTNKNVADFISENISLKNDNILLYLSDIEDFEQKTDFSNIRTIVNLKKFNLAKDLNRHFMAINKLLPDAGIYIGCFESYYNRKHKAIARFGDKLGRTIWIIDLLINRVLPKLKATSKIYKFFTRNKYKVISLAETLGRAVYCGFEVIAYQYIDKSTYFALIKTCEPKNDKNPSYGPFFKMRRIGKDGKTIGVYKMRTMHPYSEYLQDYVVKLYGYNEVGKPHNDFRVTGWGRLFRKVWIDEIPQFINLFKGDLSIVGVRPLSQFGFDSLPPDLQKERIKFKPGIIPPNVSLRLKGFDGVIEAERKYLSEMNKNPFKTNLKYFFLAIINIITRKAESA